MREEEDASRSDMALWPPSLINCDKSSLSAGAFKVSDSHCAIPDKISHMQKKVEAHQFLGCRKAECLADTWQMAE